MTMRHNAHLVRALASTTSRRADPFDVWGKPPQIILDQLGRNDQNKLRRYIERVATKVYRIAYDCGVAANNGETLGEMK